MDITKEKLTNIINENTLEGCIIYLSGPSSLDTPLGLLRAKKVICVNGSAGHLLNNNIPVFIYVVCDGSFYANNKDLFTKYSSYAQYTFISEDVLARTDDCDREQLLKTCFLLKNFCKSRGGPGRKIRYKIKSITNKHLFIKCSISKNIKTIAFSTDVSYGHYGSATVAFSALQIAISLKFERIIFSGLDLNGSCERFYNEVNTQPTTLPSDFSFILNSFSFVHDNYHGEIFNLSPNTKIPYEVIPFISIEEIISTNSSIQNSDCRFEPSRCKPG